MTESAEASFREEQRFRQKWMWLINLAIAATMWYGFVRQVILGLPFGDRPGSDTTMTFLWLAFGIGLPLFFHALRLVVSVDRDGVRYRFVPLNLAPNVIRPGDVRSYGPRTYSALREYGGWGIRYGRQGRAYTVSGDQGVQFELADGQRILIGTQQPERFLAALDQIFAGR